jgi:SAM-dependent methyltransferase
MVPSYDQDASHPRARLYRWFAGPVGETLLGMEREQLDGLLPDLFGYHIVQLGEVGPDDLLSASRISHRVVMNIELGAEAAPRRPVCTAGALPLASQSVDVVVLPHVLEFEADPHLVLRETERVLIGEGHIVILGFNPWSLWGLVRLGLSWNDQPPWNGVFLGTDRIKDWLQLLGFDIVDIRHVYFRPPLGVLWLNRRLKFLETVGAFLWPFFGGAYVVVGKKRLVALTLVGPPQAWRRQRVVNGVVGQPTCGIKHG